MDAVVDLPQPDAVAARGGLGAALAFRRLARFVTSNAKRVTAEVNSEIRESIAGIGVAKGFRRERSLWASFKDENALAYRFGLRRGVIMQLIFPVVSLAAGVGNGRQRRDLCRRVDGAQFGRLRQRQHRRLGVMDESLGKMRQRFF